MNDPRCLKKLRELSRSMYAIAKHPWAMMEIGSPLTHTFKRYNLTELLPPTVELRHGPGCPVCMTPIEILDKAIGLSKQPNVVLCSYGQMLRIKGSQECLLTAESMEGRLKLVYSPMDALAFAKAAPHQQVVFFSVGFECHASAVAMALYQARKQNIQNFRVLSSHISIPSIVQSYLESTHNPAQAFMVLGEGSQMSLKQYETLAHTHRTPIVLTGSEPVEVMQGVLAGLEMLEQHDYQLNNLYQQSPQHVKSSPAMNLINEVFEVIDFHWRGLGTVASSGFKIKEAYRDHDAGLDITFGETTQTTCSNTCSKVIRGELKPHQCSAFKQLCSPENPLGPPMVSQEGTCSLYYQYPSTKEVVSV